MIVLGFDTSNYTTSVASFDGSKVENRSRLLDVKQGELLTYDMVELEETFIYKLRKLQDATF